MQLKLNELGKNNLGSGRFGKKNKTIKPKYCVQNFPAFKCWKNAAIGDTVTEITNGPKKVRGTTPGNSLWSYYKKN